MARRLLRRPAFAVAGIAALLAAGCAETPPSKDFPPTTFSQYGPIKLDAATVEVVDQYTASSTPPHVELLFPTPPGEAVHSWTTDRLQPAGNQGSVKVVIKDASVVVTQLPPTPGITGLFTIDQAQRYDGRLDVRVDGHDPAKRFDGYTTVTVTRSITVAENISLAGRKREWQRMVQQMMDVLNAELEQGIKHDLAPMVR